MTEQHLIPGQGEESLARETAGAPQNQPTQPTGGNGGQSQKKPPTLLQLCSKAITKLNRVKLYKSPKGLRDLRNEVTGLIQKVTERISSLESEASSGDDLDQFACEKEISLLQEKLISLKEGPGQILTRGSDLRKEEEEKRRKEGETE